MPIHLGGLYTPRSDHERLRQGCPLNKLLIKGNLNVVVSFHVIHNISSKSNAPIVRQILTLGAAEDLRVEVERRKEGIPIHRSN